MFGLYFLVGNKDLRLLHVPLHDFQSFIIRPQLCILHFSKPWQTPFLHLFLSTPFNVVPWGFFCKYLFYVSILFVIVSIISPYYWFIFFDKNINKKGIERHLLSVDIVGVRGLPSSSDEGRSAGWKLQSFFIVIHELQRCLLTISR